ncbi:MAG: FIVAR domain-containing protein [Clostridium sp.]|nr:FIVAR domain-containing protein [Clostridium sp.]
MIKKIFSIAVTCTMLFQMFSPSLEAKAETTKKESVGTTYYVSTLDGNDNNDGLSENKAFYSLQKINEIELQPGDKVLLEAGSVFTNGFLHIQGSGSEEAPIEIDKYGEGNNPRIDTNGQGIWYQDYGKQLDSAGHKYKGYVSSSILLYDVEYISIKNLEITNKAPEVDAKYNYLNTMNRTGVAAVAQNKGTIDSIYLDGLNIHDVIGNVYDKHMNNGGIYFTVFKPKNESETGISRYNDIKIENCIVDNVNRWGIAVGYTAYWDKFLGGEISDEVIAKYGSTKVEIRNNYVKDAGGDAITTMYCDRPIIEYNVSDGAARQINTTDYSETGSGRVAAAVWPWKCKDAVFQYNEVFDTAVNQDGQAWDADSGDGTIYQYNYSYNNGGGAVMICAGEAVNTVFRYNISENDLAGVLNLPYHPKAEIYNNTFYIKEGVPFIRPGMTGGVAVVENNIIYNAGAEKEEDWTRGNSTVTYSNNLYYNYKNIPTDDTAAVIEDPKFVDGGSAPDAYTGITPSSDEKITHDLSAFDGYKVKDDSPAINAGKFIDNNGGLDFFGNKVSGTPDIGAYESKVASLELYSSAYQINSEDGTIAGIEKDILVKDFLKNLSYDDAASLVIKDKDGKKLNDNDILTVGSKVILSANGKIKEYTISANVDNSIKDSIYMVKEDAKTIYLPSLDSNPTTIEEVLEGITVDSTATIKVFNGAEEVKEGNIVYGMTLKVIAENGDENSYSIEVKNSYQWALDYTGKQGNVWFAQKKANGVYSNLTNYDGTYPMWNGNNYGGVGIDEANHSVVPTDATHGLLIDTLGISGREEGHSMVYRAPKSGTITLSVKDDEPYLRQAGNSGGKVKLSFTHNGEEISSYELTESFAKIDVEAMEINVNKGDLIRVEAQNIDNPTKPSIHITPQIEYQDVEVADTEVPTAPTEIIAENITENTADISWTASIDNVGVTGYEVYNGDILIATVNDGTSVKVTGLTAGTEYTLSVKAVDAAGNKSEAGTVTFKTTEIKEVDKTELGKVIEYAEEVKAEGALEDVAPAVVKEFEEALENAKAVLADENATEDEVKAASERLIDIIHMLEFKIGDKEQLEKLAQIINALDESKYIPSTWSKLQAELEKANKVLADENAMEAEVKDAYNKLIKAYLDLRLIPDKSMLEELINKAEAIDTSKYTEKSVNALNKQLKEAKKALENKEATQEEVDEASKGLELALGGLELVQGNNNNNGNNGNNENNDNSNGNNNSGNNNSSNNENDTTNNLPATGATVSSTQIIILAVVLIAGGLIILSQRKPKKTNKL